MQSPETVVDQKLLEKLIISIANDPDLDMNAVEILTQRIKEVGKHDPKRRSGFITYGKLVEGVAFVLGNGRTHMIREWSPFDQNLIGNYLSYISVQSYRRGGFFAQSVVITQKEKMPSISFFEWMCNLGVLPNTTFESTLPFWQNERRKAYEWYKNNP